MPNEKEFDADVNMLGNVIRNVGPNGLSLGDLDTTTCVVKYGSSTISPFFKSVAGGASVFKPVIFDNVVKNNGNHYDPATGFYTVPVTGKYFILTKFRLADCQPAGSATPTSGPPPGKSYCQGPHTANEDAPQNLWFQTLESRNGSINAWEPELIAGQQVRLVCYLDGFDASVIAEMSIRLIKG